MTESFGWNCNNISSMVFFDVNIFDKIIEIFGIIFDGCFFPVKQV